MTGNNPIQIQYIDLPQYDSLDSWSYELDQRLQNSISARYVNRQMVGYADLDANGTWQPESEYGPVWYPNNVPDGWRPYSTGHWAYVAPWGYTWVDDASWGFAPFHYGRWAVVEGRWGWIPGPPRVRPVYSPALVAFVGGGPGGGGPGGGGPGGGGGGISIGINFGGGGGGVAAWFPIGVGEPYVPWYRCSPTYARQVNTSNVNVAVIRNTTIVNNYNTYITNVHVTNTTVVNNTNITENHFNYANRASVTAVPVTAMSSGTSVARQQVKLTPDQQTQLARAPISVRPTAPVPATPHPSLVASKANVPLPASRPTVMTTTGQARAVPSAVHAAPVAINRLPAPRVVPKNAAPAPVQRAAPPANIRPAAPTASPVRATAPATPATGLKPGTPAASAPGQRPAGTVAPVAPQRPGTAPVAPVQRPGATAAPVERPGTTPGAPVQRPGVAPAPPAAMTRPGETVPSRVTTPPAATKPVPSPAIPPAKPTAPVTRPLAPTPVAPQKPVTAPAQRVAPPGTTGSAPRTEPKPNPTPAVRPGAPAPASKPVTPPVKPTPDAKKPAPGKTPPDTDKDKGKPEPKKEPETR